MNVLREKSSILASQRRMERKLKELNATLDQERIQHVEQRDQVPAAPPGFCWVWDRSEPHLIIFYSKFGVKWRFDCV